MVAEDYVSFETAKLLKEKGFDKVKLLNSTHFAYNKDGQFSGPSWDTEYVAPTLQMAMKWLREEKSLHIVIVIGEDYLINADGKVENGWTFNIVCIPCRVCVYDYCAQYEDEVFKSYEDACEAAIQYCLTNLI